MPTIDSRPLKHALVFVLHAIGRDDNVSAQAVHFQAQDDTLIVSANGSRGCAQACVQIRDLIEPVTFAAVSSEIDKLTDGLSSVGTQRIAFMRDSMSVDDGLRAPLRAKRATLAPTRDFSGSFGTAKYRADPAFYEFPAHLMLPAVTALARLVGPYLHVRLGLGASPLVIEAARPELGGLLSAKFAIFPTLKA